VYHAAPGHSVSSPVDHFQTYARDRGKGSVQFSYRCRYDGNLIANIIRGGDEDTADDLFMGHSQQFHLEFFLLARGPEMQAG
jgi:hypothetical protein